MCYWGNENAQEIIVNRLSVDLALKREHLLILTLVLQGADFEKLRVGLILEQSEDLCLH